MASSDLANYNIHPWRFIRHSSGDPSDTDHVAMKVYCQARPDFFLTLCSAGLILAPGNDADPRQHWLVDCAWGAHVKDETGAPAFALISIPAMKALRHGRALENREIELLPYDLEHVEDGILWTLSDDLGDGFRCIRSARNIQINMDGDCSRGGIQQGTRLIVFSFNNQPNQKWKIEPFRSNKKICYECKIERPIVRVYLQARPELFLTVQNNTVILAHGNLSNNLQEWIKENHWGATVKDETRYPAFSLLNVGTQQALKHGNAQWDRVDLLPNMENERADEVLWTLSPDVGQGFQCIRPARNVHLNLDAKHGDEAHGGVKDGNELILFSFNNQPNQKWKMMLI